MVEDETRKKKYIYLKLFHTTPSASYWHFREVCCLQLLHSSSQEYLISWTLKTEAECPLITSGSTYHC